MYYPFGYEHYLEKRQKAEEYGEELSAQVKAEDAALLAGNADCAEGGAPPASGILHGRSLCGLEAAACAYEKLEPEELEYGRLEAEYRGLLAEWKMSESYWTPGAGNP